VEGLLWPTFIVVTKYVQLQKLVYRETLCYCTLTDVEVETNFCFYPWSCSIPLWSSKSLLANIYHI